MKDRINPCIYYICANADCQKGKHNVTHSDTCQHCAKYKPRKTTNHSEETVKSKKQKVKDKDFKKYLKEEY